MRNAIVLFLLLIFTTQAHAYIGPGLGLGAIGVILGVVGSIFLALFAVFYYPIKRTIKKLKKGAKDNAASEEAAADLLEERNDPNSAIEGG